MGAAGCLQPDRCSLSLDDLVRNSHEMRSRLERSSEPDGQPSIIVKPNNEAV